MITKPHFPYSRLCLGLRVERKVRGRTSDPALSLALPRGIREQLSSQAIRYQNVVYTDSKSVSFPRQVLWPSYIHTCTNAHKWRKSSDGNNGQKKSKAIYKVCAGRLIIRESTSKVFYLNGANLGNHKISTVWQTGVPGEGLMPSLFLQSKISSTPSVCAGTMSRQRWNLIPKALIFKNY